ncbi:lysophospholipase [Polymorphobacter glacialis]|uniref:Lysophospholipase n=1 Tax=Sandarakinorhabdus glacialis TaxID=1614636 RepID=A0A916ZIE9_9SPHN|nr:DUF1489 family protein [Polymorphobacter glacialis]GGD98140.1 lysophospholipase [Polymorphobacter glacialis]
MLHLTKVAVGCPDIETLARLQQERWGAEACSLTRFMPKRAEELIGGSMFWIIRHRIVARQQILSLEIVTTPWGVKCRVGLVPGPVPVVQVPRKAHQGWRYFEAGDAPGDAGGQYATDEEALPVGMVRELQSLWLL